jgi:hypothetical protein
LAALLRPECHSRINLLLLASFKQRLLWISVRHEACVSFLTILCFVYFVRFGVTSVALGKRRQPVNFCTQFATEVLPRCNTSGVDLQHGRRPHGTRNSLGALFCAAIWGTGLKLPREIFREDIVKKTIIALSLAAFAMSFVVPAYAAGTKSVACKPAKKGYHMVGGKCVAIKKMKK